MPSSEKRTDAEVIAILTRPFDPALIKQKGRYSYISHGLITERLNEADPTWSSHVVAVHDFTDKSGTLHCAGVTLGLVINFPECGPICRTESGGPQRTESFALEIKNAQSDALKRCAMRFGVALAMWESLIDAEGDEDYTPEPTPMGTVNGQRTGETRVVPGQATPQQVREINALAKAIDDDDWVVSLITSKGVPKSSDLRFRDAHAVIKTMRERVNKPAPVR